VQYLQADKVGYVASAKSVARHDHPCKTIGTDGCTVLQVRNQVGGSCGTKHRVKLAQRVDRLVTVAASRENIVVEYIVLYPGIGDETGGG